MINLLVSKEEAKAILLALECIQNSIDRGDIQDFTSQEEHIVIDHNENDRFYTLIDHLRRFDL